MDTTRRHRNTSTATGTDATARNRPHMVWKAPIMLSQPWSKRVARELLTIKACDPLILASPAMLQLVNQEQQRNSTIARYSDRVPIGYGYYIVAWAATQHFDTVMFMCGHTTNTPCECTAPARAKIHLHFLAPANYSRVEAEIYRTLRLDGMTPADAGSAATLLAA